MSGESTIPDIYKNPTSLIHEGAQNFCIEYIDFSDGIKVYLKGHEHPLKGMAQEPAIKAADIVKRMTMEFLTLKVLIISPRKALRVWTAIAEKAMRFYLLKPEYLTPVDLTPKFQTLILNGITR